jgi:hypothetical protein
MRYNPPVCGFLIVCCFLSPLATAQTHQQPAASPELTVRGDIAVALVLKGDDLSQLPRETVSILNQDGTKVNYEGVNLREILKGAGVPLGKDLRGKALASYVVAKAHDGYQVVFSLGEIDAVFGNEAILIADKREGKLLLGHEGPFRLICPNDQAGARSVRMLETLEFVRLQK